MIVPARYFQPVARSTTIYPLAVQIVTLLVTIVAGMLIGWADMAWANLYRQWAPRLAALGESAGSGRPYFTGHWGWGYYAQAAGMVQDDPWRVRLKAGHLLITPSYVDVQWMPPRLVSRLELARAVVIPPPVLPIRTRAPRALIFFHGDTRRGRLPWGWAPNEPAERFLILRVRADGAPLYTSKDPVRR